MFMIFSSRNGAKAQRLKSDIEKYSTGKFRFSGPSDEF